MRYTVLVRQRPRGIYVATAPAVPDCKGQGATRDEALNRLKAALENWLVETEVTSIDVSLPKSKEQHEQNPWLATAGIFADDPTLEPMLQEIYAARTVEKLIEDWNR